MEISALVEMTAGKVLVPLGFEGPAQHRNTPTAWELAYVDGDFGVSVEVNILDHYVATFIYDAAVGERFRQGYRDDSGRIRKRYLTEILVTVGLLDRKSVQERNRRIQMLRPEFELNAKVLCDEEANLIERWVPELLPLKSSL